MNLRGNLFIEYINDEPNFWVFAVILKQVGGEWGVLGNAFHWKM